MIRILLADDDRIITLLVNALLTRLGHEVESVGTVAETVSRLGMGHRFDLVLLDMNMPDGTAHDVLAGVGPTVPPIVLLTGARQSEVAELLADARVRDVVTKPFTPDQLLRATERALSGVA